jgi:hypothetical protein
LFHDTREQLFCWLPGTFSKTFFQQIVGASRDAYCCCHREDLQSFHDPHQTFEAVKLSSEQFTSLHLSSTVSTAAGCLLPQQLVLHPNNPHGSIDSRWKLHCKQIKTLVEWKLLIEQFSERQQVSSLQISFAIEFNLLHGNASRASNL